LREIKHRISGNLQSRKKDIGYCVCIVLTLRDVCWQVLVWCRLPSHPWRDHLEVQTGRWCQAVFSSRCSLVTVQQCQELPPPLQSR